VKDRTMLETSINGIKNHNVFFLSAKKHEIATVAATPIEAPMKAID
jgi:hypothetical protein